MFKKNQGFLTDKIILIHLQFSFFNIWFVFEILEETLYCIKHYLLKIIYVFNGFYKI